MDKVEEKGFIPEDFVDSETKWFYNELGIDDSYFSTETADVYGNLAQLVENICNSEANASQHREPHPLLIRRQGCRIRSR